MTYVIDKVNINKLSIRYEGMEIGTCINSCFASNTKQFCETTSAKKKLTLRN